MFSGVAGNVAAFRGLRERWCLFLAYMLFLERYGSLLLLNQPNPPRVAPATWSPPLPKRDM
jgi:hypothetical protein